MEVMGHCRHVGIPRGHDHLRMAPALVTNLVVQRIRAQYHNPPTQRSGANAALRLAQGKRRILWSKRKRVL